MDIHKEILSRYWGYTSFRPLQEDIINSVSEGKDTLALMPTGGGKSLTFQVPVMAMEGLCIVITPLIALMKDQVDNLRSRGIKALAVYSGMSYHEILTALDNAILGDYKFLYISPERLGTELFLQKLQHMNIALLAVDESHCISQWGYDFRPSYMNIGTIRKHLQGVPVLALTATATSDVVDDIQQSLGFEQKNVLKKSFERKNLAYLVHTTEDKLGYLCRLLQRLNGSAIIYVRSRQKTKEIANELLKNNFIADFYHAGLRSDEKIRKQNAWKNDECPIIVSTNAFGMGIDKSNVRLVVHMDLPNSIEEYYQEAGRAGRDEKQAYAIILTNKSDGTKLKKRIVDEFPERDFVAKVYESLAYFLQIAEGFGMGSPHVFNLQMFCKNYKLPLLPTHNALKILTLAGYIEYTDEVDNKSRVMFSIFRDDLYKYKFAPETDRAINAILRLYTGVFSDFVFIDETVIAARVDLSRKEVYEILQVLTKQGVLTYIPAKRTPFVIYTRPRIDVKHLSISKVVYEDRKERFSKRILSLLDYVSLGDTCRSKMLLSYFGENTSVDCGQCDTCKRKKKELLSTEKYNVLKNKVIGCLKNEQQSLEALFNRFSEDEKNDLSLVIRHLLDNNIVKLDLNMLILR